MNFSDKFLPTAGEVGVLPMVTWFLLVVTFYALVGNAIFALGSRTSIAPEHLTAKKLAEQRTPDEATLPYHQLG